MLGEAEGSGNTGPFFPILNVPDTVSEIDHSVIEAQIVENLKRDLPRLHHLPEYGKYKGTDPIAIVAGGPSLNDTLDELRLMKRIMVCGSAHDHLIGLGFTPDYAVVCDPHEMSPDFLRKPVKSCIYLIASGCHPALFEALEGYNVVIWNSFGTDPAKFNGEPAIMGGCTVTLRAMNVALMLGFLNIHIFGLDSSFKSYASSHAYPYEGLELPESRVIKAQIGGRVFTTLPGWIAQALHFREQVLSMAWMYQPTVHGDGLIAEMMKQLNKEVIKHGL